ncbi:MAG TPA: hypothetical protein VN643_06825 [Pyrinomonadaceae bacterium]|nr:hypothetical protein [Pyrinomonadaceae bacterium]
MGILPMGGRTSGMGILPMGGRTGTDLLIAALKLLNYTRAGCSCQ